MINSLKTFFKPFRESYTFFDSHFLKVAKVVLVAALPLACVYLLLFTFVLIPNFMDRVVQRETVPLIEFSILALAVIIFTLMLVITFEIALLRLMITAEQGQEFSTADLYAQAWKLAGKYWYLGIYLLVIFSCVVIVLMNSQYSFVPGIAFAFFCAMPMIVLIQGGKNEQANLLPDGRRTIKSNFFRFQASLVVMLVLVGGVCFLADLAIANVFGVNAQDTAYSFVAALGERLFVLFVIVLSVFPPIFVYQNYRHLRR